MKRGAPLGQSPRPARVTRGRPQEPHRPAAGRECPGDHPLPVRGLDRGWRATQRCLPALRVCMLPAGEFVAGVRASMPAVECSIAKLQARTKKVQEVDLRHSGLSARNEAIDPQHETMDPADDGLHPASTALPAKHTNADAPRPLPQVARASMVVAKRSADRRLGSESRDNTRTAAGAKRRWCRGSSRSALIAWKKIPFRRHREDAIGVNGGRAPIRGGQTLARSGLPALEFSLPDFLKGIKTRNT